LLGLTVGFNSSSGRAKVWGVAIAFDVLPELLESGQESGFVVVLCEFFCERDQLQEAGSPIGKERLELKPIVQVVERVIDGAPANLALCFAQRKLDASEQVDCSIREVSVEMVSRRPDHLIWSLRIPLLERGRSITPPALAAKKREREVESCSAILRQVT
jgi:hypothetical protein